MPDLSQLTEVLHATAFLYPSVEAAKEGRSVGGSGAVVVVPLKSRRDIAAMYVVTNWHVACAGGASVIRYADQNGRTHIVDTDPAEWTFTPNGPDLAAIALDYAPECPPMGIPPALFATDDPHDIFIGEDVFMVGRFVDYDGKESNQPALRFGAVSMLSAAVRQPTGYVGRSVVVDLHSRTGFSGSPVYAYRSAGTITVGGGVLGLPAPRRRIWPPRTKRKWGGGNETHIRLLGIQWGQFPEEWEIAATSRRAKRQTHTVPDVQYVEGFSGMSCVVPASDVLALLMHPYFQEARGQLDADGFADIPRAD